MLVNICFLHCMNYRIQNHVFHLKSTIISEKIHNFASKILLLGREVFGACKSPSGGHIIEIKLYFYVCYNDSDL